MRLRAFLIPSKELTLPGIEPGTFCKPTYLSSEIGTHKYCHFDFEVTCDDVRDEINTASFCAVETLPNNKRTMLE
jgi:hypothetical protein